MSEYSFNFLKTNAERKNLWIDTQSNKNRGINSDNTNKKERISRALSWYQRSAVAAVEYDEQLIYAWIAFNALYSRQTSQHKTINADRKAREEFLDKLAKIEKSYILSFAREEKKEIEKIVQFRFLFKDLWGGNNISKKIEKTKKDVKKIQQQLENRNISKLRESIDNIYQIRIQLMHGMAAYKDIYNRTQVKLCANFLHSLTGHMIMDVIADNKYDWEHVGCPPLATPDDESVVLLQPLKK